MTNNVQAPEGFLLIDKPTGMTSAYCLNKIKHLFEDHPKIGHAGTLDSFATGLLIVGLGRPATRELSHIMRLDKIYVATGKLGQLTDTLDFTGTTIQEADYKQVTETALRTAILSLGSGYHQIPPDYSALKFEGKHLSKLARTGHLNAEQLEQIRKEKGRDIKIFSCELVDFKPPFFTIKTHVSHGTYIRVMVNDIAKKVGSIATTHILRRTAIGPFNVDNAIPLAQISSPANVISSCISVESFLEHVIAHNGITE